MEKAERDYDLNKLAELKYGRLPELQKQLQELENKGGAEDALLKEEVDEDDIARVVSTWTGIPVPVSYTHLDVYKRQVFRCCCWAVWAVPHCYSLWPGQASAPPFSTCMEDVGGSVFTLMYPSRSRALFICYGCERCPCFLTMLLVW